MSSIVKNYKVIVVNGFARGGTNILWNLFQSHPSVCSAIYETHDLVFFKKIKPKILRDKINKAYYNILLNKFFLNSELSQIFGYFLNNKFYKYKLSNLEDIDNIFKFENIKYTEQEVKKSVLCLKSINKYIKLNGIFSRIYKKVFFVGIIRNGYSLCESWIRRGYKSQFVGRFYNHLGRWMINYRRNNPNYIIVKFEDLIENPFKQSEKLYKFANLTPIKLKKLRFKSKRVISKHGIHRVIFGERDRKYWFDMDQISEFFIPNISIIQKERLSEKERKNFEEYAKPILKYFEYI